MDPIAMPRNLIDAANRDHRQAWMASLPATVSSLKRRWALELGEPFQPGGQTAWVAPVRNAAGADLVLKVAWQHSEAAHEADALRAWDGNGAVRLHDAEELADTTALLLERCSPGTPLTSRPEHEQDVVIAGLLRRLWRVEASHLGLRPLQAMCDMWADEYEQIAPSDRAALDPGLERDGISLLRTLPTSADRAVLLSTDLHAGNVLTAQRERWLAIDPKPYVGDPTYDALQHILNCDERVRADPHRLVRRMADLLELDSERLELWLFARCIQESPSWPGLADVARRMAPA